MITIENLEKELKDGKVNSIYLLYGEETFLLESCLKKIKSSYANLISGINYIRIGSNNVNELISDIETPAFGFDKKLIIARDTGLFKKDGRKKVQANSEIVERISKYINENIDILKDSITLVFAEQEADKNELYDVIQKHGTVCNFEELKTPQIVSRIKGISKAYKVQIDDATTNYLVQTCGTNMQELINEIRKLIEYVGENGIITNANIDMLCSKKLDVAIFDLTDNLGKRNISKALEIFHGLIYSKEPVQKILITLYKHFKKLYIIKLCERFNKNITDSLNLKPNQAFLVSKYKTQASYFKEDELRMILEELINLDKNNKVGLIDLNIGLESILCRYC